jgi:hypothetical protein
MRHINWQTKQDDQHGLISMVSNNKEVESCWEYWNCPKEVRNDCPAFLTYHGTDCYDFAENYCSKGDKEFKHCRECPWYKKVKQDLKRKGK